MIKTYIIEKGQKPTKKQLQEVAEAKNHPIVFDEDCPETTPERAMKFRRVNPPRAVGERRA